MSRKLTGAPRATGPDKPRRTTQGHEVRHRRQPRHINRCQAATATGCRKPGQRAQHATNHGMRTGATQHQPPSRWTCADPATNPAPAGYGTATVPMDKCAPGSVPDHCRLQKQPPSGWTCARPPATPHTRNTKHSARIPVSRSQEAQDTAHTTRSTTHRASTSVNSSQEAEETTHATQQAEGAHRRTGGKGPRTARTQHNTRREHTR